MTEDKWRRLLNEQRRLLAALISVLVAATAALAPAPATKPTRADREAMDRANEVCQPVQAADLDGQWLPCLVGEFQARRPGRYVSEDFLAIRDGRAVLTRNSVRVRL